MTMREFAQTSCDVIKHIEERNLENSVGVTLGLDIKKSGADIGVEPSDEEYKKLHRTTATF